MRFTEEHQQLRRTVRDFVEKEINPHVDKWEREGAFPAHELFKKAGRLGLLGVNKPEAYGGMGLDYSYQMVVTEELGNCRVRRDPDGARRADRHGDARARALGHATSCKQEFLAPAIAGEQIASIAVSEAVAAAPTSRRSRRPRARTATTT